MLSQQDVFDIRDTIVSRIKRTPPQYQIKYLNEWKDLIIDDMKYWPADAVDSDYETLMQIKENIDRLKHNQIQRNFIHKKRAEGLCYDCNKPAAKNRTRCDKHLRMATDRSTKYKSM